MTTLQDRLIEIHLFDTAALVLFFMQHHEDTHQLTEDKAVVKRLIADFPGELSEDRINEIRTRAKSLSLSEIADIVLEVT